MSKNELKFIYCNIQIATACAILQAKPNQVNGIDFAEIIYQLTTKHAKAEKLEKHLSIPSVFGPSCRDEHKKIWGKLVVANQTLRELHEIANGGTLQAIKHSIRGLGCVQPLLETLNVGLFDLEELHLSKPLNIIVLVLQTIGKLFCELEARDGNILETRLQLEEHNYLTWFRTFTNQMFFRKKKYKWRALVGNCLLAGSKYPSLSTSHSMVFYELTSFHLHWILQSVCYNECLSHSVMGLGILLHNLELISVQTAGGNDSVFFFENKIEELVNRQPLVGLYVANLVHSS